MQIKKSEHIETIRNALKPKYTFPYYSLIRVHTRYYGTVHIPAPQFDGVLGNPRSEWAGNLPIAQDKRDGEYYECPICSEPSFYSGICRDCGRDFEVWDDEEYGWIPGEPPLKYRNHEALKRAAEEDILRRLDSGIQDLGTVYAEIVLSVQYGAEWDVSPFIRKASYPAEAALERVERVLDGVPLDYIEGDEITVEGSAELRRHVNGIWQHKDVESGYDYWHPMARVHKGY